MPPTAPINRHLACAISQKTSQAQCSYSMLGYSNGEARFEHSNLLKVTTCFTYKNKTMPNHKVKQIKKMTAKQTCE